MLYTKFLLCFACKLVLLFPSHRLAGQFDIPITRFQLSHPEEHVTVADPGDWEFYRWRIAQGMEAVMGRLPDRKSLPIPTLKYLDSEDFPRYIKYTIKYEAYENEWVPALLYIPKRKPIHGKLPAMLALHPTGPLGKTYVDGAGPETYRAYGKELAERGYIVLAPDYPSFGDLSDYDFDKDRYESGTMAAIFYNMRAVDFLREMEEIDRERIGVIGHSLGGHNAMFTAAFDERLKVIVSSCGWTMLDYYDIGEKAREIYGGRLGPFAQKRYMPLWENFGLEGGKRPFDYHELIAMLAPRHFMSVSPVNDANFDVRGVILGIERAGQVYQFLNAPDRLHVLYPEAEHDFPLESRIEAYQFIDQAMEHTPWQHKVE